MDRDAEGQSPIAVITQRWRRHRFARFLVSGGINTTFAYTLFSLCIYNGLGDALSVLIPSIVAPFFNLLTTRTLVFPDKDPGTVRRFLAVYGAIYVLAVLELKLGRWMGMSPYLVGAIVPAPNAVVTYFAMRRFVFRDRPGDPALGESPTG